MNSKSCKKQVIQWHGINTPYYIATDRGVYLANKEGLYRIINCDSKYVLPYGFTVLLDKFYLGMYINDHTILLEGDRASLSTPGSSLKLREVFKIKTPLQNGRIHQITASKGCIWVSLTGNGSLIKYVPGSSHISVLQPIKDRFGEPVWGPENHINSVVEHNNHVFFTAYQAGGGSMIGVWDGEKVIGWKYENKGVHDFYITKDGYLFFDTFNDEGGCFVGSGKIIEFPDKEKASLARGAAGNEKESIVGCSHKGKKKEDRLKGSASIIMSFQTKFGGVSSKIQMPFAQVCQIVNLEGRHFYENTEIAPSASEIIKMLDGEFERIYEDTSDMWDINLKDINPQSVYLRKPR
jgi:hypothetical protein